MPHRKLISNSSLYFLISVIILAMAVGETLTVNKPITNCEKPHPVIYVPGFGGSQLEAHYNLSVFEKLWEHLFCKTGNAIAWLGFINLLELTGKLWMGKCGVDRLKLVYDPYSHSTASHPGLDISVVGWGDPSAVDWLVRKGVVDRLLYKTEQILEGRNNNSPWFLKTIENDVAKWFKSLKPEHFKWLSQHINETMYFHHISEDLKSLGLKPNTTLRSAPYDFRKAPNEQQEYFENLKSLVEETYYMSQNRSVVLLSHSMGGPMTLHFLYKQNVDWKKKFIKSFVSLAAPWGGTMKSLKIYVEGDNLDISIFNNPIFSAKTLKEVLVTFPSLAWMMPSSAFWGEDEALVSANGINYGLSNISYFFNHFGQPQAWELYQDVLHYTNHQDPPEVEVHCLYGNNVTTLEQLSHDGSVNTHVSSTHGDGTINLRSLEGCQRWIGSQEKEVYSKEFPGVGHMGILYNTDVINHIKQVVCSV